MSPPVAARGGEIRSTDAYTVKPLHRDALGMHSPRRAAAPGWTTRRAGPESSIRRVAPSFGHPPVTQGCHSGSTKLRADASGPLRSRGLRVLASASAAWGFSAAAASLTGRPRAPVPVFGHARGCGHATWPGSSPAACGLERRWSASCVPCRRASAVGTRPAPSRCSGASPRRT